MSSAVASGEAHPLRVAAYTVLVSAAAHLKQAIERKHRKHVDLQPLPESHVRLLVEIHSRSVLQCAPDEVALTEPVGIATSVRIPQAIRVVARTDGRAGTGWRIRRRCSPKLLFDAGCGRFGGARTGALGATRRPSAYVLHRTQIPSDDINWRNRQLKARDSAWRNRQPCRWMRNRRRLRPSARFRSRIICSRRCRQATTSGWRRILN